MGLGGGGTNGSTSAGSKVVIGGVEIDHQLYKQRASEHFNNKVLVVDDVDKQVFEMMTNVPHVSKPIAGVCAVLNLIFPGFGTLVAACASQENVSKTQMTIALMQFLTTVFIIGFIWAQYWSYLLVMKSLEGQNSVQRFADNELGGNNGMSPSHPEGLSNGSGMGGGSRSRIAGG